MVPNAAAARALTAGKECKNDYLESVFELPNGNIIKNKLLYWKLLDVVVEQVLL